MQANAVPMIVWMLVVGALSSAAHGVWFDERWPYRRAVNVTWDAEHASGRELAQITIHTAGHHRPDGRDVRVLTHDGRAVPFEVLRTGPGDQVVVAFQLHRQTKDYFVYWGHPDPPPSPATQPTLLPTSGLLMEVRRWNRQNANNYREIERSFNASTPVLGKALIDRPFIGYNPVSDEQQTISKLTGTILAPIDGPYYFAIAGDDRAGLWIDGKQVAFASFAAGDGRFNGTINLKRGQHDFVVYHVDHGGDWRLSIGWRRPGTQKLEVMDRSAFGFVFGGVIGPLERTGQRLVADFSAEYLGECFFDDTFAHRYRFSAPEAAGVEYTWDFGDGQSARGRQVEHVYLTGGVYPLKVQAKSKGRSDTQVTRLHVTRDLSNLEKMKQDEVSVIAPIVRRYDLAKASGGQLVRLVELQRRAGDRDAMLAAAGALAKLKKHADAAQAIEALREAAHDAMTHNRQADAVALLEQVPRESNLQPRAAATLGEYLVWWMAEPKRAADALAPFEKDPSIQRLRGQALVLAGDTKAGRALLESLPVEIEAQKRPALSGAMARTVEFFIGEKEIEAGEEHWQLWMQRFPADFAEGYSVLLRARLMDLRGARPQAAKIAEAFATAVPGSPYAPRLLHFAAELLKETDKPRSQALVKLLRERYPEDPLSQ